MNARRPSVNTATDDHRYLITTPWGDTAYADTEEGARTARRQLADDARDAGHEWDGYLDALKIIDRGYAPQEEN